MISWTEFDLDPSGQSPAGYEFVPDSDEAPVLPAHLSAAPRRPDAVEGRPSRAALRSITASRPDRPPASRSGKSRPGCAMRMRMRRGPSGGALHLRPEGAPAGEVDRPRRLYRGPVPLGRDDAGLHRRARTVAPASRRGWTTIPNCSTRS
ncbi:MAG: hypothetical protein WDO13_08815 [Verrucomicrobiota bacterium]